MKIKYATLSEKAVSDVAQFDLEPGDRIFLCTDGVHKFVDPGILKARLLDDKSPEVIIDTIAFLCEDSVTTTTAPCSLLRDSPDKAVFPRY